MTWHWWYILIFLIILYGVNEWLAYLDEKEFGDPYNMRDY